MSLDRIAQLEKLLRPIVSSGQYKSRRGLYRARRRDVYLAYPFLNDEEKARADYWLERWQHRE